MATKPKKTHQFYRYHGDVYFPDNFPRMVLEFIETFDGEVDLTDHAAEEMHKTTDPRGYIPLPTNEELLNHDNRIVEFYERIDHLGRIQKAVFRIRHLSEKYDYSYVVARGGVIVTAWSNDKGDNHRLTNSLKEYVQPPREKL